MAAKKPQSDLIARQNHAIQSYKLVVQQLGRILRMCSVYICAQCTYVKELTSLKPLATKAGESPISKETSDLIKLLFVVIENRNRAMVENELKWIDELIEITIPTSSTGRLLDKFGKSHFVYRGVCCSK